MSAKTRTGRRPAASLFSLIPIILLLLGASAGEDRRQSALELVAAKGPADHVAAVRERGELVVIAFPHQLSSFVRTNLELGPTPKLGTPDHFIGVDVDIMARFAEYLGVKLLIRRVSEPSYAALIPDLLSGQGDLIASSLSITEERKRLVDFSDPYYYNYPVIVVAEGSAIESIADLQGKMAALVPGSSHEEFLSELGISREWFVPVSFRSECYYSVAEGQADYTLVDFTSAQSVLPTMPGLEIAFRLPDDDYYGFAVPPGSNLLPPLNRFLLELKQSGGLAEIIDHHEKLGLDDTRTR